MPTIALAPMDPGRTREHERVRRFLAWLVPLIFGFVLVQTIAGVLLRDPRSVAVGVCIAAYGVVLLWSRGALERGLVERAAIIAAAGMVAPDIAIVALQPALVTPLILVPLLAAALALPFVSNRSIPRLFGGVFVWTVGLAALAEWLPDRRGTGSFEPLFRIAASAALIGLILLLLGQFRERLVRSAEVEHEAAERMREVDRLKTALLDAAGHDLRTPATTILGAAKTLRTVALSEGDERAMVESIERQALRLQRMLDDLLDLQRRSTPDPSASLQLDDLAEIVRDTVGELLLPAGRVVTVRARSSVVPVERVQMARIVENLVNNAVKHTPPGSKVWVVVEPVPGGAELRVDDDGPGIPPELRDEVFEPFRRGEGADDVPGSGMGLSLVARFTAMHGGNVSVGDREGGGASFRVFLPAAEPAHGSGAVG